MKGDKGKGKGKSVPTSSSSGTASTYDEEWEGLLLVLQDARKDAEDDPNDQDGEVNDSFFLVPRLRGSWWGRLAPPLSLDFFFFFWQ